MPGTFETSADTTQKRKALVSLTDPSNGQALVISAMNFVVQSGDGTISNVDRDGNPLPPNEVYLVSGTEIADTVYLATIFRQDNGIPGLATITLHVTQAPEPTVNIEFLPAEPKA